MELKRTGIGMKSICKGCGKCCYNVPLPKDLVSATRNRVVTKPSGWQLVSEDESLKPMVVGITEDGRCPYLTENNICNIYDKRPWICRKFGEVEDEGDFLYCSLKHGKEDGLTDKQKRMLDQLIYQTLERKD